MQTLFLLAAVLSAGVFWLRYAGDDASSAGGTTVKTLSTALLALIALQSGAPGWVVAGLALGSLGDFALARPGTAAFLAGMLAFALGHLAYAGGFASQVTVLPGAVWPILAAMLGLVAVTALWIAPKAGALAWPVRLYAVIIGAMVIAAAALPNIAGRGAILTGVALFAASDFILAIRLFILNDPRLRLIGAKVLWPLYWLGQALILWGAMAA
ncbi:lysoplasmalogenase [Pararhodobacter zhoushanensis]|uniref:lysoplasmalogenase n=1 Tax=Pararhodobacter zhoushanensis TaxID=2479545 RepID=UPI000F8EBA81|nr:lysoplasmalogenase [Pararhodobacter zhoushanensis]